MEQLPKQQDNSDSESEPTVDAPINNTRTTNDKLCEICSTQSDGAHFGVDTCRACAAFFRRSIVSGKKYLCPQRGNSKCKIVFGSRMCRKCRLEKCVEVGMITEQVQNRQTKDSVESAPSTSKQPVVTVPEPSTTTTVVQTATLVQNPKEHVVTKLLWKVRDNYRNVLLVLRSLEYSILFGDASLFSAFTSTKGPIPADFETVSKLASATVKPFAEFVQNTYDSFQTLTPDEQWTLFRNFGTSTWLYNSAYFTQDAVDDYKKWYLFSPSAIIDQTNARCFFEKAASSEEKLKALASMLQDCLSKNHDLMDQIRNMQPTEIEQSAIISLLLWDPNVGCSNVAIARLAQETRETIFSDLNYYYRTVLNNPEYAVRLGKLMTIVSSVQWNKGRFEEQVELYNLMDVYDYNSFIYDFVKR